MDTYRNRTSGNIMKSYFCKYIPPRPDFFATMTPVETNVMSDRDAWQTTLLNHGLIAAHGSVDDADGRYDVVIYTVATYDDVRDVTAEDPLIRSGIGSYQIFDMPVLRTL
ncbi:hypothetical protein ASG07_00165 [Sphingomonas sp. Leaf343]|nr:hypothetical protein ASG07_00165 [Sphingomonas sp. Leaf343]